VHTRILDHFLHIEKENADENKKTTPHADQLLLRNGRLYPTVTSKDLQRDLLNSGIDTDASAVWHRLLEVGRKARKPLKK
jgi:hypothetical protein